MKKPPTSRHRSTTPVPIPVRHQFDHAVPTVIHHPEEKMTVLARWAHHVFLDPKKYLTWVLSIAVLVLGAVALWNWTTVDRSKTSEVWEKLKDAKTPEDRVEIARKYPKSPASIWALLQVASDNYNLGLADMPNNRDVALEAFKKAQALYDEIVEKAPENTFPARAGLMGKARTLEARNERAEAIKQYELVATKWADSPEAAEATELAAALRKPEAAAFYKELYAYSPTKVTLPPMGSGLFDSPLRRGPSSPSRSGSGSPTLTLPDLPLVFPPSDDEKKSIPPPRPRPVGPLPDLPKNVFAPSTTPATEKAPR